MKLTFSITTFLLFSVSVYVAGCSSAGGEDSLNFNKLLVTNVVTEKKPTLQKANVRFHSHHEHARLK